MSDYIDKVNVDGEEYDVNDSRISLPLSVENGGTGQTTAPNAANALLSSLPDYDADPNDSTKLIRRSTGSSAAFGQITFSTVWNYIKSKISSVLGIGGSNGVPTAPTAAAGTDTTQIATTEFVNDAVSGGLAASQADWTQTNSDNPSYINNKPSISEDTGVNSTKENDIGNNVAIGSHSHAEGKNTSAYSDYSHAEGYLTGTGSGVQGAHSEGVGIATYNIKTARAYGSFSFVNNGSIGYVYGYDTAPNIGDCIGAVSDGIFYYAIVIDVNTSNHTMELLQSSDWSQVIMPLSQSDSIDFYICNGVALNYGSHTEGIYNTALGAGSHAEGIGTVTLNSGEHAEGEYNLSTSGAGTPETPNSGDTVHSVGIGSVTNGVTTRKNAFEILRNGNVYVYGIGGYNGTNANNSYSLQQTIGNVETLLSQI